MKKKLQVQFEEGTIELLSYQLAIGGCIMNHGVVTDVDDKIDDLPPEFVRGGDADIEVPLLEDIIVPSLTEFEATDPSPAPAPSPPAAALGPYRHVNVSRKRKSNVSHSVAGANLRRKRRRVQVDDATSQSAASLPM